MMFDSAGFVVISVADCVVETIVAVVGMNNQRGFFECRPLIPILASFQSVLS